MIKNIFSSILRPYENASPLIKEKTGLFLTFVTVGACLFIALMLVLNCFRHFMIENIVALAIIISAAASIYLLKKGRYKSASYGLSLFIAFGVITIVFTGQIVHGEAKSITNFFYAPMIIMFAALFCSQEWVLVITLIFMFSGLVSFLLAASMPLSGIVDPLYKNMVVDYVFAVLMSAFLCYQMIALNRRINRIAAEEADAARDKESLALREKERAEEALRELEEKSQLVSMISRELEDERENVDTRISEKTGELMLLNEKLQEMDRLKTGFITRITHEIRTPLTLILSPVESYLQGELESEPEREFFVDMHKNAIRLLRLINNLLDLSRIETGELILMIREIDLVHFMNNYIDTVRDAAESRGVSIDFYADTDDAVLFFDIEKLDKVVMNVLSNAIKFTDRGGNIAVRLQGDENSLSLTFRDTGMGIPAERIDEVFDRFSQIDPQLTRRSESIGIGLSLAKEFVELHGGTISVESRDMETSPDDHGTTVHIRLIRGKEHLDGRKGIRMQEKETPEGAGPVYRFTGIREMYDLFSDDLDILRIEEKAAKDDAEDSRTGLMKILVVEDNRVMQHFLTSLLKKEYRVHSAWNGVEGLRKARDIVPDLIITDIIMPEMNGYEFTREIKNSEELNRIPVLMLTARTDVNDKIEGFEYGADDYLTKPFNSKELLTRVRSLLKSYEYEKIIQARNREIENEMDIARLIQKKLFPQEIPVFTGYDTYAVFIPMDKVGGDFYDFYETDDTIEIFISDVSGHGLSSAFMSLITKLSMENMPRRDSTSFMLRSLNEVMCKSSVNMMFVTTVLVAIDKKTRKMSYSIAGHVPPILYRSSSGELIELHARGKPLGWFPEIEIEEKQLQLCKGDRLIFYTDGIIECMNEDGKLFGEDGFRKFILENRNLAPGPFSRKLLGMLREYSDSGQFEDDLSLIVFDVH